MSKLADRLAGLREMYVCGRCKGRMKAILTEKGRRVLYCNGSVNKQRCSRWHYLRTQKDR